MNIQQYWRLQAEKSALQNLLQQIPEANVIEKVGLESRLSEVEELLASEPEPTREPTRALLTFNGKPIVGSYAMFAEFGARVLGTFADAVAAIGASQKTSLASRGAIPNRNEYRLMITGTALGSFGFELEEASDDLAPFRLPSAVEPAIEQTRKIMQATLGTDDQLTEAIDGVAPRAVDALRSFLESLADAEAVCALEFKEETFRFADVGQVRRSEIRLRKDNIHESETTLNGKFLGMLPTDRRFEFQVADTNDIIKGKIASDTENIDSINRILGQPSNIRVLGRRVGESRPSYILLGFDTLTAPDSDDLVANDVLNA